jgi:hypothetical protein
MTDHLRIAIQMMSNGMKHGAASLLTLATVALSGCSGSGDRPELGQVKGKVTLDGSPLSGAIIVFKPDKGRASTSTTDGDGEYELVYRQGVPGAKIGPHTISFEWPIGAAGPRIPDKYTTKTELKEDVKEGENTLNFDLQSEGGASTKAARPVD